MLHKYGGQLDGADDRRTSLVMFACQHGAMKCLLYLRRRGIDMSVTDCGGDTPGHWAAFAGSPTAIQLLHHWGVDFSIKDDEGFTPLDRARQAQHIDCVHLLETRIVPQPPKSEEYTILGLAVHLFRRYLLNYVPCLMLAAFMATQACIWTYSMRAGFNLLQSTKTEAPSVWFICVCAPVLFLYNVFADPGYLSKRPAYDSAVEDIVNLLEDDGTLRRVYCQEVKLAHQLPPTDSPVDFEALHIRSRMDPSRVCFTCHIFKDHRTKHCADCNRCVSLMDHHCMWLNNCVGQLNGRSFVTLCALVFLWTGFFSVVLGLSFIVGPRPRWIVGVPLLGAIITSAAFCLQFALPMLWSQIECILLNVTTNEQFNAMRYAHFFAAVINDDGTIREELNNPFDGGSYRRNCWQFWTRTRHTHVNYSNPHPRPCQGSAFPLALSFNNPVRRLLWATQHLMRRTSARGSPALERNGSACRSRKPSE
ncbi:MAG: uncharacterized protein KVP18_003365 [Porospora cf. gigantea A]|uniref:uncharacterized protein n=1 Tax=Porospora cf. gigantea A TaxID=2853593 RepID=UPI0035599645|nr:MAG: hypothetical protein KVP18_003365 [Porospora cf. gigantea A]